MKILQKLLDGFRPAWTTILLVYFCYGANAITGVATVFFQKETIQLSPVEVAAMGFWLNLPWSMKMVVGVASDIHPLFGSRRAAYLLLGTAATLAGYIALATTVDTKPMYLLAALLITTGLMIQDVIADALSVEVAETEAEIGQIQTLGRMAVLLGGISVGYLSGVLAGAIGPRGVFMVASVLPLLVALSVPFARMRRKREATASETAPKPPHAISHKIKNDPLGGGKARLVVLIGLGYAALGVILEMLKIPFSQEIVLCVSLVLIGLLLRRVGISSGVAIAAMVIFLFRATPEVGQGYSYWAIDKLGFDQEFLGVLAQVSSILSLAGLLVFRKYIVEQPVSFTLFWVVVVGTILSLPNIGLFYGLHDWLGVSARTLAFIDTTITAPLGQLTMVPMLILIARTAPAGAEATMFAIMASLMNLALSTGQLFTQYLNDFFQITQADFSNLGMIMITVTAIGLLPLLALPFLRRVERAEQFSGNL
jgi:MFS family permease